MAEALSEVTEDMEDHGIYLCILGGKKTRLEREQGHRELHVRGVSGGDGHRYAKRRTGEANEVMISFFPGVSSARLGQIGRPSRRR